MNAVDILIDASARPRDAALALRGALTPDVLNAHPGGHDNSIAWLLWHTAREIDVQVSALSGAEEVWSSQGFRERFGLGEVGDTLGYGHTGEQARAVVVQDRDLLLGYLEAVTSTLQGYIGTLSDADLDEIIDEQWDPPVSRATRLVSIVDDAAQHVGQAAYAAGMPRASG